VKISAVSIKHVLGLREIRFDCGSIVEITGENGSNKTSILEALQAGLQRGNLANLANINAGEEEPEVVLVLDDGAYRIERKGDETRVKQRVGESAAYETVRRPQSFIDSLYDAQLSNPLRFLDAKPDDALDLLLQVLPVDLTPAHVREAVGEDLWPTVATAAERGGHPLQVLSAVHTALYDERTGINVSKRDKESSAQELKKALPAQMPDADAGALQALERERDELTAAIATRRADVEAAHKTTLDRAKTAADGRSGEIENRFSRDAGRIRNAAEARINEATKEAEAKIAAIREQLAKDAAAYREAAEKDVQGLKAHANEELDTVESDERAACATADGARQRALDEIAQEQARLDELTQRVATARAQADRVVELRRTKELAEQFEAEAESLGGKSERLTVGLQSVAGLKARLLSSFPLAGLEIVGKEIRINGVPFERVNQAERITLAAQVAILRARRQRLKVVFVDGAEALDTKHRELLFRELEGAGVQVFVNRVTDDPLTITSRNPEPAPEPVGASASSDGGKVTPFAPGGTRRQRRLS
jgi:DNA repair exonuclease SbcCD ATPase subunit